MHVKMVVMLYKMIIKKGIFIVSYILLSQQATKNVFFFCLFQMFRQLMWMLNLQAASACCSSATFCITSPFLNIYNDGIIVKMSNRG